MFVNIDIDSNLKINIKIERVNGDYYAEVVEQFIINNEKIVISSLGKTIDEVINNIKIDVDNIYKNKKNEIKIDVSKNVISKISLFNPEGNDDVSERKLIAGDSTRIFQLNSIKYVRAKNLYQVMIGNFRVPEKVKGLGEDGIQYKTGLTESEKTAYDGILSFLIFLDSIQTLNLPNINDYITAPEVNLILSIQDYQEAIHSQSYATILESVVPAEKRDKIYYFWKEDKHLLDRITFIGNIYQEFVDNKTDKNFFKALIGNFLLESIYFYNGFAFFDTLADMGKMVATQRMINYIRRDELTHITLFGHILREIKKENPDMFDEQLIKSMFEKAVEQEIQRSQHIIGDKVVGMSSDSIQAYTKWLANQRLEMIGVSALYPSFNENPYKHLDRLQDHNSEKGNFFESTVTNYTQSSSMKGSWDF